MSDILKNFVELKKNWSPKDKGDDKDVATNTPVKAKTVPQKPHKATSKVTPKRSKKNKPNKKQKISPATKQGVTSPKRIRHTKQEDNILPMLIHCYENIEKEKSEVSISDFFSAYKHLVAPSSDTPYPMQFFKNLLGFHFKEFKISGESVYRVKPKEKTTAAPRSLTSANRQLPTPLASKADTPIAIKNNEKNKLATEEAKNHSEIQQKPIVDDLIPLRPTSKHKIIALFGVAGAGKTTLLHRILGIDEAKDKVPPTSSSRTTTYNFEAVLENTNNYKCYVGLIDAYSLEGIVKVCLFRAVEEFCESGDMQKSLNKLSEDVDQAYKFEYALGSLKPDANNQTMIACKNILLNCEKVYKESLASNNNISPKKDINSAAMLEEHDNFKDGVNILIKTILSKRDDLLQNISNKSHVKLKKYDDGFYYETQSRSTFFNILNYCIGNEKSLHGKLLTPLVHRVRISGPFQAHYLEEIPKITIVDGVGTGHKRQNSVLDGDKLNLCHDSDCILIVDKANEPFFSDTCCIIDEIVTHILHNKMTIVFSKFDRIGGNQYSNDDDKINNIKNAFWRYIDALEKKDEKSYYVAQEINNINENRFFYLPHVNELDVNDFFKEQIKELFKSIQEDIKIKKNITKPQHKDMAKTACFNSQQSFPDKLEESLKNFLGSWFAKLNSQPQVAPGRAEHWTRIKALSRRMRELYGEGSYDTLTPVPDYRQAVQVAIFTYVKSKNLPDSITKYFSKHLIEYSKKIIKNNNIRKWESAYEECGEGSTKRRANIIESILKQAIAIAKQDINSQLASETKKLVK